MNNMDYKTITIISDDEETVMFEEGTDGSDSSQKDPEVSIVNIHTSSGKTVNTDSIRSEKGKLKYIGHMIDSSEEIIKDSASRCQKSFFRIMISVLLASIIIMVGCLAYYSYKLTESGEVYEAPAIEEKK